MQHGKLHARNMYGAVEHNTYVLLLLLRDLRLISVSSLTLKVNSIIERVRIIMDLVDVFYLLDICKDTYSGYAHLINAKAHK